MRNDQLQPAGPGLEFRYALTLRPATFATVPPGYTRIAPRPAPGAPCHEQARHGIIVYPRPLTAAEMQRCGLAPIPDSAGLDAYAARVVAAMGEYAADYRPMADEDPPGFAGIAHAMLHTACAAAGEPDPCIASYAALAVRVAQRLP